MEFLKHLLQLDIIYWDHSYNIPLILNLSVVIGLFACLRLFSGTIAHINANDELLRKDNPAFGLSLAGTTLAVTIMLSGTIYGDPETDLITSSITIAYFGILGIVLMALTRIIFDKIALPEVHLRDEIVNGNVAVSIADTSNVLAAAIIFRAVMIWMPGHEMEFIYALLAGYAISQTMLTLATLIRVKFFSLRYKGKSLQEELKSGNIALALAFGGRKIGTAFAITIASQHVVYEEYDLNELAPILIGWVYISIIVAIVLKLLSFAAEKIILFDVNIFHEIIEQRNIAVGALQASIYISLSMLLAEL